MEYFHDLGSFCVLHQCSVNHQNVSIHPTLSLKAYVQHGGLGEMIYYNMRWVHFY
jgi:hypothetical protein